MSRLVGLIVGGGRGIGRAVAERLAKDNYNISLIARTQSELDEAAAACRVHGVHVITFSLDVRNVEKLKHAVDETNNQLGSIDVVINAVGYFNAGLFDKISLEDHDAIIDINYRAPVHLCKFVVPYLGKHNRGAIIFLSAFLIWQLGYPGFSPYTGAKTALNGFAKGLFEEIRHRGVKVSTLYLGMVNSKLGVAVNSAFDWYNKINPQEMLQISDVVNSVMHVVNGSQTCSTCEMIVVPQKQAVFELTKFTDTKPFPIPPTPVDLSKKVALITGASKGIGKEIANRLASHGYDLALVARGVEALEETAADCRKFGVKAISIPADITKIAELENVVVTCVKELGNINVLINNAGVNRRKSALSASSEVWDSIIDTNFRSALQITRASLPYMGQNKTGTRAVIYISSSVVLQPGMAGVAPYYATKHAVNGFVGGLLEDVRHLGIKVCTVCPGLVNTELGTKKGPVENFPGKQLIQCEDCADAVDFVLSSSETACPISMMIHPQLGVSPALSKMRMHYEAKYAPSKL